VALADKRLICEVDPLDLSQCRNDKIRERSYGRTHVAYRWKREIDVRRLDLILRQDADELACRELFRDKKVLDGTGRAAAEKCAFKHLSVVGPYDRLDHHFNGLASTHVAALASQTFRRLR
jgi:hypothetical protein